MTNNHVAKYLLRKFPKTTPLRVQPPPKHHREIEWRQRFQFLFDLPIQDEDLEPVKANETDVTEIRFPRRTWHKLIEKVKMRAGFKQIVKVLSDVDHFPHLALAAMRKRKIQQRARYVCSGENFDYIPYPWTAISSNERNSSSNASDTTSENEDENRKKLKTLLHGHSSLKLNSYCQFTSPIRRYIDIVAHRLVIATLENETDVISVENLTELCEHCTYVHQNSKKFERDSKRLKLAMDIKSSSGKFVSAYVDNITIESFQLFFGKETLDSYSSNSISSSKLGLSIDPEEEENKIKLQWKFRLIRFENKDRLRSKLRKYVSKNLREKWNFQSEGKFFNHYNYI